MTTHKPYNYKPDPVGDRECLERAAALLIPKMLVNLPAIDGCDPWEMSTYTSRGVKKYVFTLACTERRENGYSNHATATVWVTRYLRLKVQWSHGQGHHYPTTLGSTQTYKDHRTSWGQVCRHIRRYAKMDADTYVIA